MQTLAVTRITRKNQTTIPKEVRETLDLKISDKVIWLLDEEGKVVIKKA